MINLLALILNVFKILESHTVENQQDTETNSLVHVAIEIVH